MNHWAAPGLGPHGGVVGEVGRHDPDDAVTADAGPPVGQPRRSRGGEAEGAVEVGHQHEVVLGAVPLGEGEPLSHAAPLFRALTCSTTRSTRSSQVTVERVEPGDPRVGAEPRLLAAHQPPGAQRGVGDGILERARAVDDGERLGVADRAARGASLAQPEVDQATGLVDQPRVEHPGGPTVDPGVERLPVGAQPDEHGRPHELAGGHRRAERPPGQGDHLERPHDPAAVVRLDRVGGPRVGGPQLGEQGGDPLPVEPLQQGRAHLAGRSAGSRAGRAPPARRAPTRRRPPGGRRAPAPHRCRRARAAGTRRRWPPRSRRARRSGGAAIPSRSSSGTFAVPMSIPR